VYAVTAVGNRTIWSSVDPFGECQSWTEGVEMEVGIVTPVTVPTTSYPAPLRIELR